MTELEPTPLLWWEILVRLGMALVFGGVIGFDREHRGRPAGLRTHMLIALGAAAFALVGADLIGRQPPGAIGGDPHRIIAGIVGGIGFLGAGAIIQAGGRVHGLTTAAGMWTVAAIGVACGVGFYVLAAIVTALAFLTLFALRQLEPIMPNRSSAAGKQEDEL